MNLSKLKNKVIKESQNIDNLICYCIALMSILFNLVMIFHHEAWRDEAQAWLIAKDASIFELFNDILSYEGHPCLWYLILMPFAKLGFPYITMHFISFAFMSVTTIIFVRYSPFSKIITCTAVISPIFIYFLPVISRSYSVLAFLIILLAWQYPQRLTHPFRYCVLIALLIQTHIYAIGLAFGLCFVQLCEVIRIFWKNKKEKSENANTTNIKNNILALLIPLLSALFLLFEFKNSQKVISGATNKFPSDILTFLKNNIELIVLMKKIFTEEIFCDNLVLVVFYSLVLLCTIISLFILRYKIIKIFIIFLFAFYAQLFIKYYLYNASTDKYMTIIYIFLWLIWSLLFQMQTQNNIFTTDFHVANISKLSMNMIFFILSFTFIIYHYSDISYDYFSLYSSSVQTGTFIENSLPETAVIFENSEEYCNAVIPYLKNKVIYNPFNKSKASYCVRNPENISILDYNDFINVVETMFPNEKDIYLLCSEMIVLNHIDNIPDNLEIVYETKDNVKYENFYIYHIYF